MEEANPLWLWLWPGPGPKARPSAASRLVWSSQGSGSRSLCTVWAPEERDTLTKRKGAGRLCSAPQGRLLFGCCCVVFS